MRTWFFCFISAAVLACSAAPGAGDDTTPQDDASADDVTTQDDAATTPDAGTPDVAPPPASNVQIIVEPDGQGGQQVVDAINAAKTSVHMTMYMLTSSDVISALISRHKAGLDVKVLLDSSTTTGNGSVYNQLRSAGVSVAWSSSTFTFTHEKCVIVDGKTAWIMTMNLTQTSPTNNREYLAIDTTPADVSEAETIFEGDFAGKPPSSVNGSLVVAPLNALADLTGLVAGASSTIDIEVEELSDWHTADALKAALGRGVKVRVVLSNTTLTTAGQKAVTEIKGAGGKLVTLATPYVHAKAMVVDGTTAFVGSENLTDNSLEYNRELGVIFGSATQVQKVATTIAADFAKGSPL